MVKYTWSNVPKIGDFVMYWYEGKDDKGQPRKPETPQGWGEKPLANGGWILTGSEGSVVNEGDQAKNMTILPKERAEYLKEHPIAKTLPRSPREGNPQLEWAEAIKQGKEFPFMSRFDYSVPLTELCLLGALAMRCGRPIEWNCREARSHRHARGAEVHQAARVSRRAGSTRARRSTGRWRKGGGRGRSGEGAAAT